MNRSAGRQKLTGTASRLGAFVAERYPLALDEALEALETVTKGRLPASEHSPSAAPPSPSEAINLCAARRLPAFVRGILPAE